MNQYPLTFTAVDVETTGLSPDKNRIIEIGAVKYIDGMPTEEFASFVRLGAPIPANISELTGIEDGMLEGAPTEAEAMTAFLRFADTPVILGHNLGFDYGFLKTAAVRCGMEFERQGIDTLTISRMLHPELTSRNLGAMCSLYRIEIGRAHRAFHDAKATAELYLQLYKRFSETNPDVFSGKELVHRVKKQEPITQKQKKYLIDLAKYHRIEVKQSLEDMTKSEASRLIDSIILQYGKMR